MFRILGCLGLVKIMGVNLPGEIKNNTIIVRKKIFLIRRKVYNVHIVQNFRNNSFQFTVLWLAGFDQELCVKLIWSFLYWAILSFKFNLFSVLAFWMSQTHYLWVKLVGTDSQLLEFSAFITAPRVCFLSLIQKHIVIFFSCLKCFQSMSRISHVNLWNCFLAKWLQLEGIQW